MAVVENLVKRFPLEKEGNQIYDVVLKPIKAGIKSLPANFNKHDMFEGVENEDFVTKRQVRTEYNQKCEDLKRQTALLYSRQIQI